MSQTKFCNDGVNHCFCLLENLNIQFISNASSFPCQTISPDLSNFRFPLLILWDGISYAFSQTPTYICRYLNPLVRQGGSFYDVFLVWPCLRKSRWLVKQHNLDSLQQKENHIYAANACFRVLSSAWKWDINKEELELGIAWCTLTIQQSCLSHMLWNKMLLACQQQPG